MNTPPPDTPVSPPGRLRFIPPRAGWMAGLQLLILWSFAVAYPMLQILADEPSILVPHGFDGWDLLVLIGVLFIPAPLGLFLLAEVCRLIRPAVSNAVYFVGVWGCGTLLLLPPLKTTLSEPPLMALWLAGLGGLLLAIARQKLAPVQTFLTALAPALVVFPLLFLLTPPVSEIPFTQSLPPTPKQTPIPSPPPIVFIVFDEFPIYSLLDASGQIDAQHFPNFAALARQATWFPNTYAVSDYTHYAVPGILTGQFPQATKLPGLHSYPDNLFTWLGHQYNLVVFETLTRLCPAPHCNYTRTQPSRLTRVKSLVLLDLRRAFEQRVLPMALQERLKQLKNQLRSSSASAAPAKLEANPTAKFTAFLKRLQPVEKPTLFYLHGMLPHNPFLFLPSGQYTQYLPDEIFDDPLYAKPTQPEDARQLVLLKYQRHLLQVAYTDSLLGQILQQLKKAGLYDSALIVVTGDHGFAFRPQDEDRTLTDTNAIEVLKVPFLLKAPHQTQGQIHPQTLQTTDILPTMADVLKTPLPWKTDGRSAFAWTGLPRHTLPVLAAEAPSSQQIRQVTLQPDQERILLSRKAALFYPTDSDFAYPRHPFHPLIGKAIDTLPVQPPDQTLHAEIFYPHRYAQVDLQSAFLPSCIQGRITSPTSQKQPLLLAIGINGTLQAVTQTFSLPSQPARFMTMVPKSAFQNGKNTLTLFTLRPGRTPGSAELTPVPLTHTP